MLLGHTVHTGTSQGQSLDVAGTLCTLGTVEAVQDPSRADMNTAAVVFDNATHLYRSPEVSLPAIKYSAPVARAAVRPQPVAAVRRR